MKHRARKRFGQHFLVDHVVLSQIVAAIAPRAGESLLEIGPGLGALTQLLLPLVGELTVIELDRDVIPRLQHQCQGLGTLKIINQDVLRVDFTDLACEAKPRRLIGNLPYNISTPLLFHLFKTPTLFVDMHFMLQYEVVARLAAEPGSSSYGRLSVMAQYFAEIESLLDVPREAFDPPPQVLSAIVKLMPYKKPPVDLLSFEVFESVVRDAFNLRRKTLRNSLKNHLSANKLEEIGVDPGRRAQTLTLAEFAKISNTVVNKEPT